MFFALLSLAVLSSVRRATWRKMMEEAIRARQKRGEYDAITDGNTFAAELTENLQEVSHDEHLRVDYNPLKIPERPADAKAAGAAINLISSFMSVAWFWGHTAIAGCEWL